RLTAPILKRLRRRSRGRPSARAGRGPALIELVSMRICGHAHHDDMLYLGKDPHPSWTYPPLSAGGYADPDLYKFWSMRDPIPTYARKLEDLGLLGSGDLDRMKHAAEEMVEAEAKAVIAADWPKPSGHRDIGSSGHRIIGSSDHRDIGQVAPAPPFDKKGSTFLDAVML